MSGFEVAGIVLGALPLVITALQNYNQGLSTLQKWRRYERELRSLIRNIETERVKLQNVCEKLLVGLVPPSRIEDMIDNPMGDLWTEEETLKKIHFRLGRGFGVFEDTIKDVRAAVDEMSKRMAAKGGGTVSSELKRAAFTLNRSQYADLLSAIRDGISNLENLTDRNMELEPARRVRSQGRFLMLLRNMSQSLHRALQSSLGCACGHDVSLRLEHRSVGYFSTQDDEDVIGDTAFNLALLCKSGKGDPTTDVTTEDTSIWEQIQVKPTMIPGAQPISTKSQVSFTQAKKDHVKRGVRFTDSFKSASSSATTLVPEDEDMLTAHMSPRMSIPNVIAGTASLGPTDFKPIANLCGLFRKSNKKAEADSYGTIIDHGSDAARGYKVYPISVSDYEEPRQASVISLREILQQGDNSPHLPYQNRLQLAVVLSSSILQLHGSHWLPDNIGSRDIFFATKQGYPIYNHPLVMKSLQTDYPAPYKHEGEIVMPFKCNPTLFSLGVLLIELILGETFESLRTAQETALGASRLLLDYITAQRVVDQIRMMSSNYGTAVTRCFGGDLHKNDHSLDSEDFCQEVYAGVVALLEKDLENV